MLYAESKFRNSIWNRMVLHGIMFLRSTRLTIEKRFQMKTGSEIADALCPSLIVTAFIVSIGPSLSPHFVIWFACIAAIFIIIIEMMTRWRDRNKTKDYFKFLSSIPRKEKKTIEKKPIEQKLTYKNVVKKESFKEQKQSIIRTPPSNNVVENNPTSSNVPRTEEIVLRRKSAQSGRRMSKYGKLKKRLSLEISSGDESSSNVNSESWSSKFRKHKRSVSMVDLRKSSKVESS